MMATMNSILLVEDNEDDVLLMKRALKVAQVINPLFVVEDGQQAMDYLAGTGEYENRREFPFPQIVFLDLKLPIKSGHEVLEWIRQQSRFDGLVVIVLTSSGAQADLNKAYRLGANSYLIKPPTAEELLNMAKAFRWYWLEQNRFSIADAEDATSSPRMIRR